MIPHRTLWRVLFLFSWILQSVVTTNTRDICKRDNPVSVASKTPGDNGFRIKISGRPAPEKYSPEQVYTVTINGTYPNQRLLGFMITAVPQNAEDESNTLGTFQHFNDETTNFTSCPWVIFSNDPRYGKTGYKPIYPEPGKAGVSLLWTAPPSGSGCIEFRATVIQLQDIWYKDDGALTKVICENTGRTEDNSSSDTVPDCCACGVAKYQMTFHGLWSRQTHPKDFPTNKYLLHWSNIVGASHSKNYIPWQYGAYATKGVQEVCEYGYPKSMELEIKQHSEAVRTVIKTSGIWVDLKQSRWARFSVNTSHHFMSMLTMVGPSPDWCVGVSALNLCLPNCTWAGHQTINLYPWDAGTDSGITYMARNQKTDPQEKIHRITNSFPNNPASPFYHQSQRIKPMARLELRRIHPKIGMNNAAKCESTPQAEEEEEEEEDNVDFDNLPDGEGEPIEFDRTAKRLMMIRALCTQPRKPGPCRGGIQRWFYDSKLKKCLPFTYTGCHGNDNRWDTRHKCIMMCEKPMKMALNKCAVTRFGDWGSCSTTCGVGVRIRRRIYVNRNMTEEMCGLSLTEEENCLGLVNECESRDEPCAVSNWSYWSPCSATCGRGSKLRRRFYLRKSDINSCSRRISDQTFCVADILDCSEAEAKKNYTAICPLPKDEGRCRGDFERWYFDVEMNKCMAFSYSGCRGNENRFRNREKCQKYCESIMAIRNHPGQSESEGSPRNRSKVKDKAETRSAEKVNCKISAWTEWSTCSSTCGRGFIYRTRAVEIPNKNGGKRCPKKLKQKKKCHLRKCRKNKQNDWNPHSNIQNDQHNISQVEEETVDCELGDWGSWSPCGKTCGEESIQERSRPIVHKPRRGGNQCGPNLQRRYCYLPSCDVMQKMSKGDKTKNLYSYPYRYRRRYRYYRYYS